MTKTTTGEAQILLVNRVVPALQEWEVDDSFSLTLTDPTTGVFRNIELDAKTYARIQDFLISCRNFRGSPDFRP